MNYLILKSVDINSKDKNGLTPLHYASIKNNEIGAQRLLKEDHISINVRNDNYTVNTRI
jgi:ankyrin repeat protein